MTTSSLPYVLLAVVLLIGLSQRLYALFCHRDDPVRRTLCAFLAALLAATITQLFSGPIDQGSGVPHLGAALSDASAMVAACSGQLFLLYVTHAAAEARAGALRRYAGLVAALLAAAVLFLVFPQQPDEQSPVYFAVYIWYVGITMISVCRLGIRYARRTDLPFLRAGLRIIAAGTLCGLAFLTTQAVLLVAVRDSRPLDAAAELLELATEVLFLIGVTVPGWGPALADRFRWLVDYYSYRRLRPLWLALHDVEPEYTLPVERRLPSDVGLLLYRQVIEIRDAQLALRQYVDPRVTAHAENLAKRAGMPVDDARATVEAAAIASAIAVKTSGREAAEPGPVAGSAPGGASLAEEVAWLRKVARAFHGSPIVTEVVYTDVGRM
jgi:hypothetical protein